MTPRFPLALLSVAALALAACTATTPATPSPEPQPVTTPAPATPQPATPQPVTPAPVTPQPATPQPATPDASTPEPGAGTPGAIPTIPSADTDLEAMLPDRVGELTMTKVSLRGDMFADQADDDFLRFLGELGVTPSQITVATATGFSLETGESVIALALRAPGANAQQLMTAFSRALAEGEEDYEVTPEQVGGKNAFAARTSEMDAATYFYAVNDVLIIVVAEDQLLEETFAQLP
jgi:hypothetical protein